MTGRMNGTNNRNWDEEEGHFYIFSKVIVYLGVSDLEIKMGCLGTKAK